MSIRCDLTYYSYIYYCGFDFTQICFVLCGLLRYEYINLNNLYNCNLKYKCVMLMFSFSKLQIVFRLFGFLRLEEIFECRTVCQLWNEIGTPRS
jgi:hypothetical protein